MNRKHESLVNDMLAALNADMASRRRYAPLYETLLNASKNSLTLSQAELQVFTEIPQAIISQMLKRMIICGIVRIMPEKVNGLNQYTVVAYDKIDYERVRMACQIFEMQARTKTLRESFAQRYDPLP
mgnify:CR=1 FL=1